MTALALALFIALTPPVSDGVPTNPESSCGPRTIRVFVSHRRGSSIPARVVRVSMRTYVSRVMNGGAWPAHKPMESLKVGAIAIRQYATWHIRHPQRGYVWRGVRYDIRDGDQLYRRPFRQHSRTWAAIDSTRCVELRKGGRYFRTGWRGYSGRDGWHLHEDTVTRLARRGWHWRRIVHQQLDPVAIRP